MSLYLHDFMFFIFLAAMGLLAYKLKSTKFRIAVTVFAVVLILLNPIRLKQSSGEFLERSVMRFNDVPEKVEVQQPPFSERQAAEYDQLKKQSKEIHDEI